MTWLLSLALLSGRQVLPIYGAATINGIFYLFPILERQLRWSLEHPRLNYFVNLHPGASLEDPQHQLKYLAPLRIACRGYVVIRPVRVRPILADPITIKTKVE